MKRLVVDFSDANDGGAYTGSQVVDLTSDEISEKESQSRSDEQRGLDVIRLERDKRLSETDWWASSDRTRLEQTVEPLLKTQLELEAHEKECAIRYAAVQERLDSLDKRMWRLEAMIMGSTILVVAMVVSVFMGIR